MNNASAAEEEQIALAAIYGPDRFRVLVADDLSYALTIPLEEQGKESAVTVTILLPTDYPTRESPIVEIREKFGTPNWISDEVRGELQTTLLSMHGGTTGRDGRMGVVLFEWIEWVRSCLEVRWREHVAEQLSSRVEPESSSPALSKHVNAARFEIHRSATPLVDRKSVFEGFVAKVSSTADVKQFMEQLMDDFPRLRKATHNIMAYRVVQPNQRIGSANIVLQDFDEDGETAAGGRLLRLLELCKCRNVVVVVSRVFGGIQLGPDRFKHINNVARDLLEANGFLETIKD